MKPHHCFPLDSGRDALNIFITQNPNFSTQFLSPLGSTRSRFFNQLFCAFFILSSTLFEMLCVLSMISQMIFYFLNYSILCFSLCTVFFVVIFCFCYVCHNTNLPLHTAPAPCPATLSAEKTTIITKPIAVNLRSRLLSYFLTRNVQQNVESNQK